MTNQRQHHLDARYARKGSADMKAWIAAVASAFDLTGTLPRRTREPRRSDAESIAADWDAVGGDFAAVLDRHRLRWRETLDLLADR